MGLDSQSGREYRGWRNAPRGVSLPEVHRTVRVPANAGIWARLLAFIGPGYLVAVGYMDPGNWATDIQGGAHFRYQLLSVILISNFIAVFLQALSAKVGIALWISAEIGIIACDIAEVLGAAIALQLLFHIPYTIGVVLTALDVLLVLG